MNLDGDGEGQEEEELPPVRLTLANMKALTALLLAIKINAKQVRQRAAHLWDGTYYACVCYLPERYRCLAWSQSARNHHSEVIAYPNIMLLCSIMQESLLSADLYASTTLNAPRSMPRWFGLMAAVSFLKYSSGVHLSQPLPGPRERSCKGTYSLVHSYDVQ